MTHDTHQGSELETLRRERDEARAARQAALEQLATISHELRTPLTGILGMANLLLGTALDDEQREYANTVLVSGEHLLRLVNDAIDLSRLEAGAFDLQPVPASPAEAVRDVAEIVSPQAGAKRLDLTWHIEGPLEELYLIDPARLRQVLLNLAGNAVKFTDRGAVRIGASVESADAGRKLAVFTVSDSGIGMDAALRASLFRRFTRAGPSERRGAGLGLAISRQIVELMGGEIGVEGAPGAGSRFRFTIPLVPAAEAVRDDRGPRPGAGEGESRALSLLLADDDDTNRLFIATLLRKGGHSVTVVADGAAAIDAVRAKPYDAVLMDIHMPGLDGVQATAKIRALAGAPGAVPVIALTADALEDDERRYLADGFSGYVAKPVRCDALAAALSRATGGPVSVPDYTVVRPAAPASPTADAGIAVASLLNRIAPSETAAD